MFRKIAKIVTTMAIVLFICAAAFSQTAEAGAGFSATPVLPENQAEETRGFFDLYVSPGTRQTITIDLFNGNDFDATFDLTYFKTGTNRIGVLDYVGNIIPDETLQHEFTDVVTLNSPATITVPSGATVPITMTIEIPHEGFDGIILGSIHFLRHVSQQEQEESGMFINQFAHVIIIRLRSDNMDIAPDFILTDVSAESIMYTAAIVAEIRHPVPRLTMGALLNVQIYQHGNDNPIFNIVDMTVDFAPNTVFPFAMMDFEGFGIHPGDYTANISLYFEGETWEFTQDFVVEVAEAAVINETAINQQQAPLLPVAEAVAGGLDGAFGSFELWQIIAGAAAIILLISIPVILVNKSNQKHKREMLLLHEKISPRSDN